MIDETKEHKADRRIAEAKSLILDAPLLAGVPELIKDLVVGAMVAYSFQIDKEHEK